MTQKTLFLISATAIVAGALGMGIGRIFMFRTPHAPADVQSKSVQEYHALRERYHTTTTALKAAEARVVALENLIRKQARIGRGGDRAPKAASQSTVPDAVSHDALLSDVNWEELARLVDGSIKNLASLVAHKLKGTPLPEELQKKLNLLEAKIKNYGLQLRTLSDTPLLDKAIYHKLISSLLNDSLALTEDQLQRLSQSHDAMFDELLGDTDPGKLFPLERHRLCQEVLRCGYDAVENTLEAHQRGKWELLAGFSDELFSEMFGYLPVRNYALKNPNLVSELVKDWGQYYPMDSFTEAQKDAVTQIASNYVKEAQAVVERYGATEEGFEALSPEIRDAMHEELLDLQQETERGIFPFMEEWQVEDVRQRLWIMIRRFTPAQRVVTHGRAGYGMSYGR